MEEKKDKAYPSQLEKVKEITDRLEAGIHALFESDTFKNYLKTLSKFHDYSLNNTILIAMQKPDATLVAGYTAWQRNRDTHPCPCAVQEKDGGGPDRSFDRSCRL